MKQVAWLLLSFVCLTGQADDALADDKVRTWTDVQGRPMQAQFVRELDGDVTFLKDGKLIVMPLDQLSEADRQHIRDLEAKKSLPSDARPASPATASGGAAASASSSGAPPSLAKKVIVPSNRVWTDTSGNKMTATFVRMQDKNVVVVRTGRTVSIPFDTLIAEDQAYVREVLTARGEAGSLPQSEAGPARLSDAPEAATAVKTPAGGEAINSDPGPSAPRGNSAIFDAMREREAKRRQEQSEFAAAPAAPPAPIKQQEPQEPIAASPAAPAEPQATKSEVARTADETDLTHGGPPTVESTTAPTVTSVRSLVMFVVAVVGVIGTIAIVISVAIALASPNSSRQQRRLS